MQNNAWICELKAACLVQTMYQATFTLEQGWSGQLQPYAPLQMDPRAQILNYGQSVFEGMKAQRTAAGNIVLFRPDENAARMMAGAHRRHKNLLRHDERAASVRIAKWLAISRLIWRSALQGQELELLARS